MTTLAGHTLLSLRMTIPRTGAWVADVVVDTDAAITGAVTLEIAGRTWRGTVTSGDVELGRWSGRVVGGAGGLQRSLAATAYADTDLRTVVGETLRDAGETLSAASGDLSAVVTRWARAAAPAAHAVGDVARSAGMSWRVARDGSVWIGADAWSAVDLGAVDVIERDPRHGRWVLAGDGAALAEPGVSVTLDGAAVHVGAVEHSLDGDALRTTVTAARDEVSTDRFTAAVAGIAERTIRPLYLGRWPARVVAQHDDGTLDVVPDDARIVVPRGIAYRTLPGVRLVVATGTRVAVVFEAGDPAKPVADLWELGDVTRLVVASGTHPAAREGHATGNGGVSASAVEVPGTPVTTTLRLTYTPPGGVPQTISISGLPAGVTASGSHSLAGVITEGADVLHLP